VAKAAEAPRSAGVTLVELLVVLAVLGVMAGMVGLAWQPGRWAPAAASGVPIGTARRRALESGAAVQATLTVGGRMVQVIAFPDGRMIGAEALGVNPLTGEATHGQTAPR
jgi:prepilin-type N-terminal cleavage/methylation domain-containing protein